MSSISRQPTTLDYASPTQFKFGITQLPKVEFFVTNCNLPGITLGEAFMPTPLKQIPMMGDELTFDNLTIGFQVAENFENYIELHNWLLAIGFPKSRKQFSDFRAVTSNTPTATRGAVLSGTDIGQTSERTPANAMFSDATLTLLSNKNNPLVEVRFQDLYPLSLSALDFTQEDTDVTYLKATTEFAYKYYEIVTL
jgi:hypothetical protein